MTTACRTLPRACFLRCVFATQDTLDAGADDEGRAVAEAGGEQSGDPLVACGVVRHGWGVRARNRGGARSEAGIVRGLGGRPGTRGPSDTRALAYCVALHAGRRNRACGAVPPFFGPLSPFPNFSCEDVTPTRHRRGPTTDVSSARAVRHAPARTLRNERRVDGFLRTRRRLLHFRDCLRTKVETFDEGCSCGVCIDRRARKHVHAR